jgi:hypothetical protein
MRYIGRMQSVSFDMYRAPSPFGFIMKQNLHYISWGLLILTRMAITLIASPHLVTHSVFIPGLSIDRARRKLPLFYLQPRKSKEGYLT